MHISMGGHNACKTYQGSCRLVRSGNTRSYLECVTGRQVKLPGVLIQRVSGSQYPLFAAHSLISTSSHVNGDDVTFNS